MYWVLKGVRLVPENSTNIEKLCSILCKPKSHIRLELEQMDLSGPQCGEDFMGKKRRGLIIKIIILFREFC